MSSSPTARGTRAERDGAPAAPVARRAFPEPSGTRPQAHTPADRPPAGTNTDRGFRPSLQEPERRLLANLAMAVAVIFFITVVLPMLMSLVRNF